MEATSVDCWLDFIISEEIIKNSFIIGKEIYTEWTLSKLLKI